MIFCELAMGKIGIVYLTYRYISQPQIQYI
jgi:hypothetical protein